MPVRSASAQWNGNLKDGSGSIRLASGAFEGPYSYQSRMEDGAGTNPEELIAAAHAGCFSMALSATLAGGGHTPKSVKTAARVHFGPVDGGFAITSIELNTEADVPGIDEPAFQASAKAAKEGCPVSKALTGTKIELTAKLV